jgi:hypothetical protein
MRDATWMTESWTQDISAAYEEYSSYGNYEDNSEDY